MKIAVIGNGIVGYTASEYLSSKGYEVDCIGPDEKSALEMIIKNKLEYKYPDQQDFISPKFSRPDIKKNKIISDEFYKKKTSDFFAIEFANEMGLAKYWGANLACDALKEEILKLALTSKEIKFISQLIPILDVQKFYTKQFKLHKNIRKINKFLENTKNKPYEIKSSKLAIWSEKCEIKNLPGYNFSKAIFGNEWGRKINFSRIIGKVEFIEINKKDPNNKITLHINEKSGIKKRQYNFVIVASGSLGSYRIIKQSFFKISGNLFDKINHHPIITTISFLPLVPYPRYHFGTSNFNLKIKSKGTEAYVNFIPLESAIKAVIESKIKIKNKFIQNSYYQISKITNILDQIPFSPNWFLRRLYFTNINLSSQFTASYINNKQGEINIIGGLRSDFEKELYKKIWPSLTNYLRNRKIYSLFIKPLNVAKGADLHYASSLSNYTNDKGQLKINGELKKNIIIVDSSSSKILPIANPTYYFISRAIRLLRSF